MSRLPIIALLVLATAACGVAAPAPSSDMPVEAHTFDGTEPTTPSPVSAGNLPLFHGETTWARATGGGAADAAVAVAIDASSRTIVAGTLGGPADVGCGLHASPKSAYVAAYDAVGGCVWATYFDSIDFAGASAIALADGAIYVTGTFSTSMADPTLHTSAGGLDAFVAKLDDTGAIQWTTTFGGAGDDHPLAIAASPSRVAVGGADDGYGGSDMFVAQLNVIDGVLTARKDFGGSGRDAVNAVAFDAAGNLFVGGAFTDGTDLGDGQRATSGDRDGFIAKYTQSFALLASATSGDAVRGIAIGSRGVVVASETPKAADITTFPADLGAPSSSFRIASDGDIAPTAIATSCDGSVVVTGRFSGKTSIGVSTPTSDAFVAAYGADGTLAWARSFGAEQSADARAVACSPEAVVVAGAFEGGMAHPLATSAGSSDGVVVRFTP